MRSYRLGPRDMELSLENKADLKRVGLFLDVDVEEGSRLIDLRLGGRRQKQLWELLGKVEAAEMAIGHRNVARILDDRTLEGALLILTLEGDKPLERYRGSSLLDSAQG
ncbi:hypothetical protein BHM03_00026637 [Ensete ventricosum]|nr:hypothetical protein BHM03_00026637 [Ensete ventricosum]